ncbi:DUF421 domain-containing protein [Burkholderia cenocepacia]|uniref:DUF421 domain-containing protein n=3 Tax=Burkholderia cenocepacia TaxID=95486 RepID=UPI0013DEACDA|nr:DUF421 domain-containing protein [Burkholderia cenocepacia]MCW3588935.1 DUF421 domain-containing protein [Burkholderia cenocepacia]MCW5184882.1 DUF421 domain-containing protein [Burkholderia cenocepacia]NGO92105.1 hypothetical protein [Burkholderia cenocepacia]
MKTILLYALTLAMFRLMGQRTMGDMMPFDFVVVIAIAEILGAPLADGTIPLTPALLSILTLVALQQLLAWASLKSATLRRLIEGQPLVIIRDGRTIRRNMARGKVSMDDVAEKLRQHGITAVHDVELAALEPDGDLSVILKREAQPVTPRYLGLPVSRVLVDDGRIDPGGLAAANVSEDWLAAELAAEGTTVAQVELALIDPRGKLLIRRMRPNEIRRGTRPI